MPESPSYPFSKLSGTLRADLNRAVTRYLKIERICTASGCASPDCLDLAIAREYIALTVLHHAGFAEPPGLAPLPQPETRQPSEPVRRTGFVYVMKNHRNGFFKIGFSRNPAVRESTLQAEEPEVSLVMQYEADQEAEVSLHQIFADKRVRGEWFRLGEDDLPSIRSKLQPK